MLPTECVCRRAYRPTTIALIGAVRLTRNARAASRRAAMNNVMSIVTARSRTAKGRASPIAVMLAPALERK
jgi:hypothetical protein